mmetsp:Transcript_37486/g.68881  ORF Transcript_37486/g.68881 Transcript_37486/m.68881 type:complete len:1018 (+) Transcript_37486:72-3125(+)
MNSNRRFQKKKNPSNKNGFFFFFRRCKVLLLILISAAVLILSISTLMLSWVAVQKDHTTTQWGGVNHGDMPHLQARRHTQQESRLGKVAETKNQGGGPIRKLNSEPLIKHNVIPIAKSNSGPSNSEIYQPPQKGRRLLTYRRFGGRLNNQLFQFITSLQHAKVLKRTFVVPDEVEDVTWTGMFDKFGIWNLTSLNSAYDIDWTSGLSAEFTTTVPRECRLSPTEAKLLLNGGPTLWEQWDAKCPDVIDIDGTKGLLFCGKQQHQFCGNYEAQMEAYTIYDHIQLSSELLQYLPSKRAEFKDMGYNKLAIHSRRAGGAGYDWEICVRGNSKTCNGHLDRNDQYKFCDSRTMKGNCALWSDLAYQIKNISVLKSKQKDYRFVLASDGTHDWNIDYEGQFIVANNTDWLLALERRVDEDVDPTALLDTMAVSAAARNKLNGQKDLTSIRGRLDSVIATILDLFSLVDSEYLLGAYYSTLSLNACLFRGMDRIYDSNMCWMLMHPDSKYAILPPFQESVHVNQNPKQDDPLPPALMSDVEHAFIRSNDGNFIAIDRYLIRFKGNEMAAKKKEIIGVVGDGLVPITILKNDNGEESVRADFTCSYGNQLNSPATVILMKGHQSYNDHYYSNGEKYNTPFSTNGDRFRTLIILCEKLVKDPSLSKHPPLILKSQNGIFLLSIGSAFQTPVGRVTYVNSSGDQNKKMKDVVHCLSPMYGLKDPRWIIEYLEYHRAIGVSHVHVYNVNMHSPEVQDALQAFRNEGFITRHDWSDKASGGYTTFPSSYGHAKWAAQTDCALRSRDIYDYALFSDIDEIGVGGKYGSNTNFTEGHLAPALDLCDEAKEKRGKIACSFNSNTVSSNYTKLNEEEELTMKDKLILERYDRIEAKPHCPFNCRCLENNCTMLSRKFHYGRQKYMANVRDLSILPRPMWTHAISRDYDEMDEIMEVLPDEVMHIRHYQGHWYKNSKEAPLPESLMRTVRSGISSSRFSTDQFSKRLIYSKAKDTAKSNRVEWIEIVEMIAQ